MAYFPTNAMGTTAHSHTTRRKALPLTPLERVHGRIPPLMVADIVLVHHKKNFTRSLLQKITDSYWDHAAMIVSTKDKLMGNGTDIIEESIQFGVRNAIRRGVEVHQLNKYLSRPDLYDVGIKRVPFLDKELRGRVRSFMLMNVDTPYYRLPTLDFIVACFSERFRKYLLSRQRFSCSGLIQKAFYEASDWDTRPHLIFRKHGGTPIELQELTTPGDIAKSENCEWVWNRR